MSNKPLNEHKRIDSFTFRAAVLRFDLSLFEQYSQNLTRG